MGGSAVTNKPKPEKLQVGSGGDTHLINNVNYYIAQSPPCANQDTPSDTPSVDTENTKKTRQMDFKSPKPPLRSEHMGFHSRDHGRGQTINRCPGYLRNSCSYSETIDTGAKIHAYTKESTGIETGMVNFNLPFRNVTSTPNRIRVK